MVQNSAEKSCIVPDQFVDTNISGYTIDARDTKKQTVARDLITKLS